jgi:hypothetical protein
MVGFGDFPMAAALSPAVTVVDQDPAGLGRIAVERLLQRIEDPHAPPRRRTVLLVHLIPRGSASSPPASKDEPGRKTMSKPGTAEWRRAEAGRLLTFGRAAALADGGFGWLDAHGEIDPAQPCPLYLNARMTYVFALAHLDGVAGA